MPEPVVLDVNDEHAIINALGPVTGPKVVHLLRTHCCESDPTPEDFVDLKDNQSNVSYETTVSDEAGSSPLVQIEKSPEVPSNGLEQPEQSASEQAEAGETVPAVKFESVVPADKIDDLKAAGIEDIDSLRAYVASGKSLSDLKGVGKSTESKILEALK